MNWHVSGFRGKKFLGGRRGLVFKNFPLNWTSKSKRNSIFKSKDNTGDFPELETVLSLGLKIFSISNETEIFFRKDWFQGVNIAVTNGCDVKKKKMRMWIENIVCPNNVYNVTLYVYNVTLDTMLPTIFRGLLGFIFFFDADDTIARVLKSQLSSTPY